MNSFTLVFLGALALSLATRLWLARRHIRHVAAHRERVPRAFAEAITLESPTGAKIRMIFSRA